MSKGLFSAIIFALIFSLLNVFRVEALTLAGTTIANQATASFVTDDSQELTVVSDPVETTVSAVCALNVSPSGGTWVDPNQTADIHTGEQATFSYTITNAGNSTFTIPLSFEALSGSEFTPADVKFYSNGTQVGSLNLAVDASANLSMVVTPRTAELGVAYLALAVTCDSEPGSTVNNNVAKLSVEGVPQLSFNKDMNPQNAVPGDTVTVTLNAVNGGNAVSSAVTITDMLNTPGLAGMTYVPGSFQLQVGTAEFTVDGTTWSSTEPAALTGLRWNVPAILAGGTSTATFKMKVEAIAVPGVRTNTASVNVGTGITINASLTINDSPLLTLGPINNSGAPEGSEEDTQRRNGIIFGQPVCFKHTLHNTGNVPDTVSVTGNAETGQADIVFQNLDGSVLSWPVTLQPNQPFSFKVCFTPSSVEDLQIVLSTTSNAGAPVNRTTDIVTGIEDKPVDMGKTVAPNGPVSRQMVLTYTLSVTNPFGFPLENLAVVDALNPILAFVDATDGGVFEGGAARWTIPVLAPGESRTFTVRTRIKDDAPDDYMLENCFTLGGPQFGSPVNSPCVSSPVWSAALRITKTANAQQVTIGDRLDYTITALNTSQNATLRTVTIIDTLPEGLAYLPGTSQIDGVAVADPEMKDGSLVWTVTQLGPNATTTIKFGTRVLPTITPDFVNRVVGSGTGALLGIEVKVDSNVAVAATHVRALFSKLDSDLIGLVFIDRNEDRIYQPDRDTPLARARIILSDGRTALTDEAGRYHFANVEGGRMTLRLDPNSVPYAALAVPQDGGRLGSRSVLVSGLTSVDFPLRPLAGEITAIRDLHIAIPPLSLTKTVRRVGQTQTYNVRLTLTTSQALLDFVLDDPLPPGAQLISGQNKLQSNLLSNLPTGETVLSYSFILPGDPLTATIDPTVSWRRP